MSSRRSLLSLHIHASALRRYHALATGGHRSALEILVLFRCKGSFVPSLGTLPPDRLHIFWLSALGHCFSLQLSAQQLDHLRSSSERISLASSSMIMAQDDSESIVWLIKVSPRSCLNRSRDAHTDRCRKTWGGQRSRISPGNSYRPLEDSRGIPAYTRERRENIGAPSCVITAMHANFKVRCASHCSLFRC